MGLEFVKCDKQYWDFVLDLRNGLREGFICQNTIDKKSHYNFMEKYTTDYYICLDNSVPVGWAGVLNNDIRVATHPDHQKKGIGKFLINELMNLYPNSCAKIKVENIASQRLFESCGFKKKSYRDSCLLYILERKFTE